MCLERKIHPMITLFLLGMYLVSCSEDVTMESHQDDGRNEHGVASDLGRPDSAELTEGCVEGHTTGMTMPARSFESLDDGRYCEVLVVYEEEDGQRVGDVYNSLLLGDCPQEQWDALSEDEIAADFPDALSIMLNGPRYFLMQDLFGTRAPGGVPMVHAFGDIRMVKAATVALDQIQRMPYTPTLVTRSNTWRFRAGQRVHELIDDAGRVFVMQSFAQIVDPDLSFEDLVDLEARLQPPSGWRYRVRTLSSSLDVQAGGTATVIQDELENTYQLRSDCRIDP